MSVINRIAQGFLDLVDAQNQGKSPPTFVDAVAPTVDMTEFYLADVRGGFQMDANHGGPSTFQLEVGGDEIWRLRAASVRMPNAGVASAEQWAVSVSVPPRVAENSPVPDPGQYIWMTGVDLMVTTTPARDVVRATTFANPIVLLPGSSVLFQLLQRDAGAARISNLNVGMDILRR